MNDTCKYCPAGRYAETSGMAECTLCPIGTATENVTGAKSAAACTTCPAGKHSNWAGIFNETIASYPENYAMSGSMAWCKECRPGRFSNRTMLNHTYNYGNHPDNEWCWKCPAGYISQLGATTCAVCEDGKYHSGATYGDEPALSSCESCDKVCKQDTTERSCISPPEYIVGYSNNRKPSYDCLIEDWHYSTGVASSFINGKGKAGSTACLKATDWVGVNFQRIEDVTEERRYAGDCVCASALWMGDQCSEEQHLFVSFLAGECISE
jgi:hypothetical protein